MVRDIKSIEEIQEGLSDHEVRISALENSMPNTKDAQAEEIEAIEPPTIRHYRPKYLSRKGVGLAIEVEELRRKVLYLENKVMEMRSSKRKKGRYLD